MQIQGLETVLFTRLQSVFGSYIVRPAIVDTQFVGEWAGLGYGQKDQQTGTVTTANDGEVNAGIAGGMTFDQIAKVCHPAIVPVNHDNTLGFCATDYGYGYGSGYGDSPLGPNGLPQVLWGNYVASMIDGVLETYTRVSPGFNSIRWGSADPGSILITGDPCVPCQGFKWLVKCGPSLMQSANTGPSYCAIRFRVVGSGNTAPRWYAVSLVYGLGIQVGYNDSTVDGLPVDSDWVVIDQAKVGAGLPQAISGDWDGAEWVAASLFNEVIAATGLNQVLFGNLDPEEHALKVEFKAGLLKLTWDNETTPFLWPHEEYGATGLPDWCIDLFQVSCQQCYLLDWSVHPIKFATSASCISVDVPLSNTPDDYQVDNVSFRVHTLPFVGVNSGFFDSATPGFIPDGTTVGASLYDIEDGSIMHFTLGMTGEKAGSYQGAPYANFAAMVNAVTTTMPAESSPSPYLTPIILGSEGAPIPPEYLRINHQFDINTLSYKSRAELTFNNFEGAWTNSDATGFLDELGHFGIQIELGSEGVDMSGDVIQGGSTYTQFTGIANTDFVDQWQTGGADMLTLGCDDYWLMVDVPIWNLRFFDFMNGYFVIHELLQFAGVPDDQIAFVGMGYLPPDPYSPSPGLPDDQQIFLPGGPAGTQLTRFAGGSKCRDIILKIAYGLGMSAFFDVFGVFQFEPFLLPTGWNPSAPAKLFSSFAGAATSDLSTCGLSPGADEVWTGQFKGGLRETRNAVMTIGPQITGNIGNVVTAYMEDTASILDDGWGSGGNPNFKGFRDLFVWIDNIFANPSYANQAAAQMINFLRVPDREVEFRAADNPLTPIYPGYLVRVLNPRSGSTQFNMFVTSLAIDHVFGQIPSQTISARIIPAGFSV